MSNPAAFTESSLLYEAIVKDARDATDPALDQLYRLVMEMRAEYEQRGTQGHESYC